MGGLKPFSQACVNNRDPIISVLEKAFQECHDVLEIGSGTGQHAIYFAPRLPFLTWQPSDRKENLAGIHAWVAEQPARNIKRPLTLDVDGTWPQASFDGFFTANTCHIMPWRSVINMFAGIGRRARANAVLAMYGPFKYDGKFTTESNASFDQWLKSVAPHQGIRDIEDIVKLAEAIGFRLLEDHALPANNQLLLFSNRTS